MPISPFIWIFAAISKYVHVLYRCLQFVNNEELKLDIKIDNDHGRNVLYYLLKTLERQFENFMSIFYQLGKIGKQ